jgi:hypothetical protein
MKKLTRWISIILLGIILVFIITSIIGVKNTMDSSFTKVERPDYTITAGIKILRTLKKNTLERIFHFILIKINLRTIFMVVRMTKA